MLDCEIVDKRVYKAFGFFKKHTEGVANHLDDKFQEKEWKVKSEACSLYQTITI